MTPDPRWLEILKASGLQTAAIAIGCSLLLWADQTKKIPALDPWMVQLAVAVMVICGLLAVASFVKVIIDALTGFVRLAVSQLKSWKAGFQGSRELWQAIETLNTEETAFLKGQVEKNEMTVQLHPFNARGIPNFVQQAAMFHGLQNKGIVSVTATDPQGKIQVITIEPAAWKKLKKRLKEKKQ